MSALLNFLGGAAFRAIWGDVSTYFKNKQEHKLEIERMRLQGDLDAAQHARNMAAAKQQAELGFKTIEVQAEAAVSQIEADAWRQAATTATKPVGIAWVDAWNASVRPAFATVALLLWGWYEFRHMAVSGWVISAWSLDIIASIIGFWYASREIAKRK